MKNSTLLHLLDEITSKEAQLSQLEATTAQALTNLGEAIDDQDLKSGIYDEEITLFYLIGD